MSSDEGTWFRSQTARHPSGPAGALPRWAAAEQAATAMLIRRPELLFVDVAEYVILGGTASQPSVVDPHHGRAPSTPEDAAVDDLHRLPRGDPEC